MTLEDPKALAEILDKLSKDPASLDQLGVNARKYALANFAKREVLPRLTDLIESVYDSSIEN